MGPTSYRTLAAPAVAQESAMRAVWRNMPELVPALVLDRLAAVRQAQCMPMGASLQHDAAKRAISLLAGAGIRALPALGHDEAARTGALAARFRVLAAVLT